jgi:hypothetical protein
MLTDEQRQSVVEKLRNLGYHIESDANDIVAATAAVVWRLRVPFSRKILAGTRLGS